MEYGCQQVALKSETTDLAITDLAIIEYLCGEANKLHNCGVFLTRQVLFKAHRWLSRFDLNNQLRTHPHYRSVAAQAAQQVLGSVYESFQSYRELNKRYQQGELARKPRLPRYRKPGLHAIAFPKQAIKLEGDRVRLPLGNQVRVWFGIRSVYVPMPSNLNWEKISEVRLLPRNGCVYAEFVYRVEPEPARVDPSRALGIDPGLGNWLTCISNTGKSFVLDGRKVKSQNQWYNKRIATLKEGQPQGYWDDELAAITEKRNRQMRDNVNKAARFVINWCLLHQVGTVVFGWNNGNKTGINLGKRTNQSFVQVPTARLKDRIEQLCQHYGIQFVETEESYTSKASFLDGDFLPTYNGEKPAGWEPSGKRVNRGLYRTASGLLINADCNGAANILRKVATQLGISLAKVGRAVLTLPKRYDLDSLSKKYRASERRGFNPLRSFRLESPVLQPGEKSTL